MPQFYAGSIVVNDTTPFTLGSQWDTQIKNVGNEVVWIGSGDGTTPITPANSYPLEPGETLLVRGDPTATGNIPVLNTAGGTSDIRYLAIF